MVWTILLILVILLLVAAVPAMLVLLRTAPAVDEFEADEPQEEEPAARRERQLALEPTENALLQRRVELDARRGTLGGDNQLLEAFDELERRQRAGEISEAEFEAEKVRLLGG